MADLDYWNYLIYVAQSYASVPHSIVTVFTAVCMGQLVYFEHKGNAQSGRGGVANSAQGRSVMFKFLMLRCVAEALFNVLNIPFVYLIHLEYEWTRSVATYNYFVGLTVPGILTTFASLMEMFASLDCLITISGSRFKKMLSNKMLYISATMSLILSFLLFSNNIIQKRIELINMTITTGPNESYQLIYFYNQYRVEGDDQNQRFIMYSMQLVQAFFRDLLLMVLLIVINTAILGQLRKNTQRKKQMNNNTMTPAVKSAAQAERRKCIMIVSSGIAYFFGHVLYLSVICQAIYYNKHEQINPSSWHFMFTLSYLLLQLNYSTSFYLYYFFNRQFKKYANQNLEFMFYPIVKLFKAIETKLNIERERRNVVEPNTMETGTS